MADVLTKWRAPWSRQANTGDATRVRVGRGRGWNLERRSNPPQTRLACPQCVLTFNAPNWSMTCSGFARAEDDRVRVRVRRYPTRARAGPRCTRALRAASGIVGAAVAGETGVYAASDTPAVRV